MSFGDALSFFYALDYHMLSEVISVKTILGACSIFFIEIDAPYHGMGSVLRLLSSLCVLPNITSHESGRVNFLHVKVFRYV